MQYRFFNVKPLPLKAGRKTREYVVLNVSSGDELGWLRWYAAWRQFCFFAEGNTVWSAGCLKDLLDALEKITAARRNKRAEA